MMRLPRLPVPVWVTLLFAVVVGSNEVRHTLDGRRKLEAVTLSGTRTLADIDVLLNVAPEPFHMTRLQQWGTMTGADGRTVRLRNVAVNRLPAIAREPWVASLATVGG